jgi:hypothetical protein
MNSRTDAEIALAEYQQELQPRNEKMLAILQKSNERLKICQCAARQKRLLT